jgi:hypothetical protein
MDYNRNYLLNLMQAHSQYFNAWLGGSADISISARIGEKVQNSPSNFWIICELIVDTAFFPLDGKEHCIEAYKKDSKEDYKFAKGGVATLVILSILLVLVCVPLGVLSWTYVGIKKCIKILT